MVTVWGRVSSSNVQAVMWCIEELKISHQRIDAGFTYGVVDTEEYLAMNPNGTVPTVKDGDNPAMFESCAIIRYLAAVYGDDHFWPDNPVHRATVDQWAEWAKLNIALKFTAPIFWQVVRIPAERHNPDLIKKGVDTFEKNLSIAEARLQEHPFLAGDHFTPADIELGHILYRYYDMPIERADLPGVAAYYKRLTERSAYQQHVMLAYDELKDSM